MQRSDIKIVRVKRSYIAMKANNIVLRYMCGEKGIWKYILSNHWVKVRKQRFAVQGPVKQRTVVPAYVDSYVLWN